MKAQIELGADGLVKKLQKQIDEQAGVLELQRRQNESLKSELNDVHRLRAQELQRNELETRELYLMLRDAQDIAASNAKKQAAENKLAETDPTQMRGILDRERLLERLERQLERTKTQFKLEGKVWNQDGPSDRLRELREQMEGALAQPEEEFEKKTRQTLTNSTLGSVTRKKVPSTEQEAQHLPEVSETEEVVEEKEKVTLETFERPRMNPMQATGLLGEIAAKVRKYDSDEEAAGSKAEEKAEAEAAEKEADVKDEPAQPAAVPPPPPP
ncbi:hypothetical protein F66182_18253, partial [Fusarium sp. NRRL 66182]